MPRTSLATGQDETRNPLWKRLFRAWLGPLPSGRPCPKCDGRLEVTDDEPVATDGDMVTGVYTWSCTRCGFQERESYESAGWLSWPDPM